jgi:hypothetical protein
MAKCEIRNVKSTFLNAHDFGFRASDFGFVHRRRFLADLGMGFTGLALGAMLYEDGLARSAGDARARNDKEGGLPAREPKAKSVIWLFMMGGVSHLESFDPKPALNKYADKTISKTPFEHVLKSPEFGKNFRFFTDRPKADTRILPLQIGYRKRGQSGIEVSDWWPHVSSCVDDLAVVRSLWTTDFNHSAQLQMHTGRMILDGRVPCLGSWVHYGLGSLNRELPSFVVLGRPPSDFGGGKAAHKSSYLGPAHDGVPIDVDPHKAMPYLPPKSARSKQRADFELLGKLNRLASVEYPHDPALRARIQAYELAFGMQTSLPEVVRLDDESEETKQLYGLDHETTRPFGQQCLAARRLVERGVRFIQVYHGGDHDNDNGRWDSHQNLRRDHTTLCQEVDRPIAGLLRDLKRRGLLESTLVVWATEFGRAPNVDLRMAGPIDPNFKGSGRDHHIYGFSAWLAGGGIKGGVVHGRTDELGYHAVENRHYVTDLHSTILHQLGLDSRSLEIPGRRRLDLEVGRPILEIVQ